MKLVWSVAPKSTGMYRSFSKRAWPTARFKGTDNIAAVIYGEEEYRAEYRVIDDVGFDLEIRVTITIGSKWEWRRLKKRARSLKEAKQLAEYFYDKNPQYVRRG